MKKLLMLLLFPLLMAACTKEEKCVDISNVMSICVSDELGNDLLDPSSASPQAVDTSKLNLYYVRNGKEVLFYRPYLDYPKGLSVYPPGGNHTRYQLDVGVNIESEERITTSILKWEDGHRDVFKAEIYRNGSIVHLHKVWVNDSLIWDPANKIGGREPIYKVTR